MDTSIYRNRLKYTYLFDCLVYNSVMILANMLISLVLCGIYHHDTHIDWSVCLAGVYDVMRPTHLLRSVAVCGILCHETIKASLAL